MDAAQRRELQRAMTQLADGDRSAFHPVFILAWPVVRAFAHSLLREGADAEDAAQQALLSSFERASQFDQTRDALAWLLGIAAYECRTLRRRRGRQREEPLGAASERAAGAPSPEARLVKEDLQRAAREVLASLAPTDIETIVAALDEPPSRPSVLTAAAFRKRLERARRRLRSAWGAKHGTC
jgi:DNA-directed RNA polymerase specialized sigma24 family protein